jgi:hypothetical protein
VGSEVRVQFDVTRVLSRLQRPIARSQIALDMQVIKDSNFYCPEDRGDLQDSAILGYNEGKPGEVSWNTPYARLQYYDHPNKSHDKNPNARMKWFDEAKAAHLADWEKTAQGQIDG